MSIVGTKARADDQAGVAAAVEATRADAIKAMGGKDVVVASIVASPEMEETDAGPVGDNHGMSKDDFKAFLASRPKVMTPTGAINLAVSWTEAPPKPAFDPREV